MNCHELENYLPDYWEGELDEPRTAELMAHIEACEACRAEFKAYEEQDRQLRQYYGVKLEKVLRAPNPVAGSAAEAIVGVEAAPRSRTVWLMAAAAMLLVAAVGSIFVYRRYVPMGDATIATIGEIRGRVSIATGGKFVSAMANMPVRQGERVKIAAGGYLSLKLPDGNTIELREGTQAKLLEYSNRIEVAMNRGHVLSHLTIKPEKKFTVRTAHLTATAVGTVFDVEEGMDRSIVRVAEGIVLVVCGGEETLVHAGEVFNSRPDAITAPLARATTWSRLQENFETVNPESDGREQAMPLVVQASEIVRATPSAPPAAPPEPVRGPDSPIVDDLVDLLPVDTGYFLDIRDWRGIRSEFKSSDYKKLFDEPNIQEWWNTVHGKDMVDGFVEEMHLLEILDIAKLVDGQLVMGVTQEGQFLLVADCMEHEQEVGELVQKIMGAAGGEASDLDAQDSLQPGESKDLIADLLREQARQDSEQAENELRGHVHIGRGRLIVSSSPELADQTLDRVLKGEPSGFSQTDFYRKVKYTARNARFMMAADLAALMDRIAAESDEREINHLRFLGAQGLDYLLISPNFVSRGMSQAARIGFRGKRSGAVNWLGEPAPMRGLDFFSPDIHIFASAIVRSPRQMFFDYLLLLEMNGETEEAERAREFFDAHEPFFDAFGGEIAIGVDSPILPVPNVKIALEVTDPSGFADHLTAFIDGMLAEIEQAGRLAFMEENEHKGYTIRTLVIDGEAFEPSYAFVEDYLVLGPGEQFVRDSIDVYVSGRSIAHDPRLTKLMPGHTQLNMSILVYQDIARSIPDLVQKLPGYSELSEGEASLVPNADFLEKYRAPGVAFAYAHPTHIDLYLNATGGIDFNVGMAAPLVADWLLPRTDIGRTIDKYNEAMSVLDETKFAIEMYAADRRQMPRTFGDLIDSNPQYLASTPLDPFAEEHGQSMRWATGQGSNEIVLYSIGPDGIDDLGKLEYNPESGAGGRGDIVVRVGAKQP